MEFTVLLNFCNGNKVAPVVVTKDTLVSELLTIAKKESIKNNKFKMLAQGQWLSNENKKIRELQYYF